MEALTSFPAERVEAARDLALADTGFHPLDGARYLDRAGRVQRRLARVTAGRRR